MSSTIDNNSSPSLNPEEDISESRRLLNRESDDSSYDSEDSAESNLLNHNAGSRLEAPTKSVGSSDDDNEVDADHTNVSRQFSDTLASELEPDVSSAIGPAPVWIEHSLEQKLPTLSIGTQADEKKSNLLPIVIDGSNVAMGHGNKQLFSCKGIRICVDWFRQRNHKDITVFVPKWRKEAVKPESPMSDQPILLELEAEGVLNFTPSRQVGGKRYVCHDDRYILNLAALTNAVVVSNDNYRELIKVKAEFKKVIEEKILMYSFIGDRFMPPDDPLGRGGPTLDQFLRVRSLNVINPCQPCPYGKKCTYGHKCKFFHAIKGQQACMVAPHAGITAGSSMMHEQTMVTRTKSVQPPPTATASPVLTSNSIGTVNSCDFIEKSALCRTQSHQYQFGKNRNRTVSPPVCSQVAGEDKLIVSSRRGGSLRASGSRFSVCRRDVNSHMSCPTACLAMFTTPPPPINAPVCSAASVTVGQMASQSVQMSQTFANLNPALPSNPIMSVTHRKLSRQLTLDPFAVNASAQRPPTIRPDFKFPPPNMVWQRLYQVPPPGSVSSTKPNDGVQKLDARPSAERPDRSSYNPATNQQHTSLSRILSAPEPGHPRSNFATLPDIDSNCPISITSVNNGSVNVVRPVTRPASSVPSRQPNSAEIGRGVDNVAAGPVQPPSDLEMNSAASFIEARSRIYFHLASIFPVQQVTSAMATLPNVTEAQVICRHILNLTDQSTSLPSAAKDIAVADETSTMNDKGDD